MHLLERYALNTGAKIDKPYIREDYFPNDLKRHITFHPIGSPHKYYSYWQEVINLLFPVLSKEGIDILQVGGKEENQRTFSNSLNVLAQTSIPQLAYLIKRGELHLGIDSFPVQFAGYYDKNIVALYSHVMPEHRKPYWGSKDKQVLIQPDRKNRKPSYSFADPHKSINTISPSKIAASVCGLLGLDFNYEYESVFIGERYAQSISDLVLDSESAVYDSESSIIRARMDLHHDENKLGNLLQNVSRPCDIIIDKKIDLNLLKHFQSKIGNLIITYNGTNLKELGPEYFDVLNVFSFGCSVVSYESEEKNNEFKLANIDSANLMCNKWPRKEDAQIEDSGGQLYYKSSKTILSKGKMYSSYYSYVNDIPKEGTKAVEEPIVDDELFWRDLPFLNILKK
ncbi:MAG: hypothetical protein H8E05_00615 [Bacteroidetes bacterium]|nr:hypothetical protein [Bacteroidota bacterium]